MEKYEIEQEYLTDSINKWKGRNYFFCKGSIMMGPSGFKPFLITGTFITTPTILFLYFNTTWISQNISPGILVLPYILIILAVLFMSMTAFSDPGILKRRVVYDGPETNYQNRVIKTIHLGFFKKLRICKTCNIVKPYRSTHCQDCDNCVERFDHHCPWLGNCVAKRNYKFFYLFLVSLNFLCFYLVSLSVVQIVYYTKTYLETYQGEEDKGLANSLSEGSVISIFIILYILLMMIFVTGLFIYHTVLIFSNLTTKEELKKTFKYPVGNPYRRDYCKNATIMLCPKISLYSLLDLFSLNFGLNSTTEDFESKVVNKGMNSDRRNKKEFYKNTEKYTRLKDYRLNNKNKNFKDIDNFTGNVTERKSFKNNEIEIENNSERNNIDLSNSLNDKKVIKRSDTRRITQYRVKKETILKSCENNNKFLQNWRNLNEIELVLDENYKINSVSNTRIENSNLFNNSSINNNEHINSFNDKNKKLDKDNYKNPQIELNPLDYIHREKETEENQSVRVKNTNEVVLNNNSGGDSLAFDSSLAKVNHFTPNISIFKGSFNFN